MKYFKHTFWLASLLTLLLSGCSNDQEATPTGGDLTLTLTIPGAQQSTRGIAPEAGESTLTNVYLLFYAQGAADGDKPTLFSYDTPNIDGEWKRAFSERALKMLTVGETYDIYAVASLATNRAELKVPTATTTKSELLALNDYRCYCEGDAAISFYGTGSYTKEANIGGEVKIDLTRTVARLDFTLTSGIPAGSTLQEVWLENARTYTCIFNPSLQPTEGRANSIVKTGIGTNGNTFRFYPFANATPTTDADRMFLNVLLKNADGDGVLYRSSINQAIEQNNIYNITASLTPEKTIQMDFSIALPWEAGYEHTAPTPTEVTKEPEANSYMVTMGGKPIYIPVSQINTANLYYNKIPAITGSEVLTAELVWTDVKSTLTDKGLACDAPVKEIRVISAGTDALLQVTPGTVPGNALVAVKDATGTIRWSWHIWVIDPAVPLVEKTYTNTNGTYVFMDRHLGATSITPGNLNTYGLAYQWGRKDPFPQAGATTVNYTVARVVYDAAGKALVENNGVDNSFTIARSITTPWRINTSYGAAWWNSDFNGNMWGNGTVKTVYDPCPAGWRVPAQKELAETIMTVIPTYGLTHSQLGFFPLAGRRYADNCAVTNAGAYGLMNVSDGSNGNSFYHYQYYLGRLNLYLADTGCEDALSVRCVKIVTP